MNARDFKHTQMRPPPEPVKPIKRTTQIAIGFVASFVGWGALALARRIVGVFLP